MGSPWGWGGPNNGGPHREGAEGSPPHRGLHTPQPFRRQHSAGGPGPLPAAGQEEPPEEREEPGDAGGEEEAHGAAPRLPWAADRYRGGAGGWGPL